MHAPHPAAELAPESLVIAGLPPRGAHRGTRARERAQRDALEQVGEDLGGKAFRPVSGRGELGVNLRSHRGAKRGGLRRGLRRGLLREQDGSQKNSTITKG